MNQIDTKIFLYLLIYLTKTSCLRCPGRSLQNCECREFQFHSTNLLCPNKGIHVIDIMFYEFGKIDFACSNESAKYADLVPSIDLSKTHKLKMEYCDSFMQFDYVLKKLNLTDIKQLHVNEVPSQDSNKTEIINEEMFKLMENLEVLEYSYSRVLFSENFLKKTPNLLKLSLNHVGVTELNIKFDYVLKLRKIILSMNNISSIPDETFKNLSNLTELYLDNNRIELLSARTLLSMKNLKLLDLSNNNIGELSKDALSSLKYLEIINFSENDLAKINEEAFTNNILLKVVLLRSNKLQEISEYTFQNCLKLVKIDLCNNQLKTLPENLFQNLKLLIHLDLSANKLNMLPPSIFSSLAKLKRLDLRSNKFKTFDIHLPLHEIMELLLAYNEIAHYPETNMKIKNLDLSFNRIEYVAIEDIAASSIYHVDLRSNNIKYVDFNTPLIFNTSHYIHLEKNSLLPDCFNYNIVKYCNMEKPSIKPFLTIVGITLKPEDIYCLLPEECPHTCTCYYKPFNNDAIINCSSKNLTLFSVENLTLFSVEKSVFNIPEYLLRDRNVSGSSNWTYITHLDLSENFISTFKWVPPPFVKEINLKYNKISNLDVEVLEILRTSKSFERIYLEGNPWECSCESLNLQIFLKEFYEKTDSSMVYCHNTNMALININNLCKLSLHLSIFLSIGLGALLCCAILAAIFFRFPMEIKSYLYERQWLLRWITEEDLDKDKQYDVFISYANQDETFVFNNLLCKLESECSYKVCIHTRDWNPGELIVQQIMNSVQNSRRTLIVLSNNFLESVWGKIEFRAAHTRAMQEGRIRVIVVIYGSLDENKLDDELKSYIKTNTYIKWNDKWFWEKLRYALPHHKRDGLYKRNPRMINLKLDELDVLKDISISEN